MATGLLPAQSKGRTSTLGDLLIARRQQAALELPDLTEASGLSAEQIQSVEAGRHSLTDAQLRQLLTAYGVRPDVGRLSRPVVEICLEDGSVTMRSTRQVWTTQADADENLLSYLALLYESRDMELGQPVPLKSIDLSLLRAALALRRPLVEEQLDRLGTSLPDRLRRNKSLLSVAAAAGVAVAAGAIILIPAGQPAAHSSPTGTPGLGTADVAVVDSTNEVQTATDPRIEIGTALVIERSPEAALLDESSAAAQAAPDNPQIEIGTAVVIERSPEEFIPTGEIESPRTSRGPPVLERPGKEGTR